jgi:hypothetical protein
MLGASALEQVMSDRLPESQPHILEARRHGLLDRMHELTATVLTLVDVATELRSILDQRDIPEVQDLLDRIGQKAHETAEKAEDLHTALDRHFRRIAEGE